MSHTDVDADYYSLLGVERDSPQSVIRESYRRLMQQGGNHPDLGGDTQTAALINKAYTVLKDPARRGDYDMRLNILARVTMGFEIEPDPMRLDPASNCLFCGEAHHYGSIAADDVGCESCGSPLRVVQNSRLQAGDLRAVHRLGKEIDMICFTHWQQQEGVAARTEDSSPQGLRMITRSCVQEGQRVRLMSSLLEAVGVVTHCTQRRHGWRTLNVAGVSFLTLKVLRSVGGFMSQRI